MNLNLTLTAQTQLRNEYGALDIEKVLSAEHQVQLKTLLESAVSSRIVPMTYIKGDKKYFECLNHDIFDVLIFRGKVKGFVLQARKYWKEVRKNRSGGQKSYFLVMRAGKQVVASDVENNTCAKRAKNTTALGQLVNHYLGKKVLPCKPVVPNISDGYKVLAKNNHGKLVSAYDDSEYMIGTWRVEAARANHGGGYYFYSDKELAISATARGDTFSSAVSDGKTLVLCEVECAGRQVAYEGGKKAATRLRVTRELGPVVVEA